MSGHDNPSLTPEERDLAERLSRLGPHDGPPAALDARILAAAHDAVAATPRRNRRGWLGLSGGAGGLITGVGLAASLTVVLGVVWQLRPTDNTLPQMDESPAGTAEEVILIEEELPSTEPRTRIVEPPPAEDAAPAPVPLPSESKPAAPAAPRTRAAPASTQDAPAIETAKSHDDEVTATHDIAAEIAAETAPALPQAPAMEEAEETDTATPAPATELRRATYTRAARAQAEQAGRKRESSRTLYAPPAPAPAATASSASDTEENTAGMDQIEADEATLDAMEATGSRTEHTTPQPPLHEDTGLAPADWLERIRARRDAGDVDTARESLRLFRKAYPRARLPDDLRALLETAGPESPRQ